MLTSLAAGGGRQQCGFLGQQFINAQCGKVWRLDKGQLTRRAVFARACFLVLCVCVFCDCVCVMLRGSMEGRTEAHREGRDQKGIWNE